MSSLYAQYVLEREGKRIIENEYGFATFSSGPDFLFIEDMFVLPEHRSARVAWSYADRISAIARSENKSKIVCTVAPAAKGATTSLKAVLAYGFNLGSSDNNLIYFFKEL